MFLLRVFRLYLYLISPVFLYAQYSNSFFKETLNIPQITHFTTKDFKADPQFWAMCKDSTGVRYFGNNDGVLVYDGERWQKVVLPNSSSIRSLLYTSQGMVFAGGYNEFGLIKRDSFGTYYYESIVDKLQLQNRNLENVWQVHESNKAIIYRTFDGLVVLQNGVSTYITAPEKFTVAAVINSEYYVQDTKEGILHYDVTSGQLSEMFSAENFSNESISAMVSSPKAFTIEIITTSGHIYEGNTQTKTVRKKNTVFVESFQETVLTAIKSENTYVFGTLGSKIIMVSGDGYLLELPLAFKEIQDATVLGLFQEEEGLWVLLNNGLDFIRYAPPGVKLFDKASVYDVVLNKNTIVLATNKGMYYADNSQETNVLFDNIPFKKVEGTEGQVWSLNDIGETILINHDKGLMVYQDGKLEQLGITTGIWKTIPIPDRVDQFLACAYDGLYLVEKRGTDFRMIHKLKGFNESSRDIIPSKENGVYWVCHGYKGVFKIKIDDNYERVYAIDHYTDQNGFPSYLNINAHYWDSNIVFSTNHGLYKYDKSQNSFIPHDSLNIILGTTANTRKIVEEQQVTWLVQDDEIGYFDRNSKTPELIKDYFLPLKGQLNRGMESIHSLGDMKVLIGAKTGLYFYNLNQMSTNISATQLTSITYQLHTNRKTIPIPLDGKLTKLPEANRLITFHFAVPKLGMFKDIQYSYMLKGIEQNWSSWSPVAFKEYSLLPPGDYTFMVKSRNDMGAFGTTDTFSFTIETLWYKSTVAIVFYTVLLILLGWITYRLINRRIQANHRKMVLATENSNKLLELEVQQLKLVEDKITLEEDVLTKNKKLANYTIQLVNKKQAFIELQEDLKELRKLIKNGQSKKKLFDIFRKLHQHKIGEEYLEVFDIHFEEIHRSFFEKLRIIDTHLTKRELRLAAFVKMNLANKEIAPLLSISVRGVETARYRLSKKLNIPKTSSLQEFLESL